MSTRFNSILSANSILLIAFFIIDINFQPILKADELSDGLNNFNPGNSKITKIAKYNTITILLSSFYYKNQIFILQAYNSLNQKVYIAIDCFRSEINVTDKDIKWKKWKTPKLNFEKTLLYDICNHKYL